MVTSAFSPTIRQNTPSGTYNDYVTQAYQNPTGYGAVGTNGVADAYGANFGAPGRYQQYQDVLGNYMKANPLAAGTPTNTYSGGVDSPQNLSYEDALKLNTAQGNQYQGFLNSLSPSQQAEYNQVSGAHFDKANATNKGAMMAIMMAAGGLGAAGMLGGGSTGLMAASDATLAGTAGAVPSAVYGGTMPAFTDALPAFSGSGAGMSLGGSDIAANAGIAAGEGGGGTMATNFLGQPALETALNGASYADPLASVGGSTMMPDAAAGLTASGTSMASTPWSSFMDTAKSLGGSALKSLTSGTGGNSLLSNLIIGGVNASMGNKAAGQYNDVISQINNLYSPDSPYAQQMKQALERKDAAAGRNSQYGDRSVQLAAALTNSKMQALTSPGYQSLLGNRVTQQNIPYNGLLAGLNSGAGQNLITQAGSGITDALQQYFGNQGNVSGGISDWTSPNATYNPSPSGFDWTNNNWGGLTDLFGG